MKRSFLLCHFQNSHHQTKEIRFEITHDTDGYSARGMGVEYSIHTGATDIKTLFDNIKEATETHVQGCNGFDIIKWDFTYGYF